jgi:polysaccharide export outer membrane protein
MNKLFIAFTVLFLTSCAVFAADTKTEPAGQTVPTEYFIGIDDVLDISVMQPEKLSVTVTVSPDGTINFPYIGTVQAKNLTLLNLQDQIQKRLSEGYMKYPVVSVFLKENRSKKFFIYGEVNRPGTYMIDENATVLKAISTAGGFTKYGSSSRVKVLRPKAGDTGYDTIKVNLGSAMDGNPKADVVLHSGDIVVVSEGVF